MLEMSERIVKQSETPISAYRTIRYLTGMTVRSFAKELKISHTYWNDLESGNRNNPSQELIKRISLVSGLSEEAIVYLTKDTHPGSEEIHSFIINSLEEHIKKLKLDELAK